MKQKQSVMKTGFNYSSKKKTKCSFKKKVSPFFNIAQQLELLAVRSGWFSSLYAGLFYEDMLNQEFAMADLHAGASVLHIGCGAYPYTALYLAKKGCYVDACDCNEEAVDKAQALIEKEGYSSSIKLLAKNGLHLDCANYDAIWLSLNICPKEKLIFQALKTMSPAGKLIYRNNPQWLEKALFKASQVHLKHDRSLQIKKIVSNLGAESILIRNEPYSESRCWI